MVDDVWDRDRLPPERRSRSSPSRDTAEALLALGRAGPRPVGRHRDRHHRFGGEDLDQGSGRGGSRAPALRTIASEKSFNNELGVPLTLANAYEDVEAAVIEMGARGSGHIADCAGLPVRRSAW